MTRRSFWMAALAIFTLTSLRKTCEVCSKPGEQLLRDEMLDPPDHGYSRGHLVGPIHVFCKEHARKSRTLNEYTYEVHNNMLYVRCGYILTLIRKIT